MKSQTLEIEEEEDEELGPSEFAYAITRIAVAQICQSVGFSASQRSALDTLADVAARYLRALAESAAAYANSSGRTQSNLYDVVRALGDLNAVQGFRGAWNVNQTLLTSSVLTDLMKFVEYAEEIPFAKPIHRRKQSVAPPSNGLNSANSMNFSHIPKWLPAIPDMGESEIDGKETQEEERSGIGSCGKVDSCCLVGEKTRVGEGKGMELPERRPRVRFKMGVGGEGFCVDLSGGVCRGGKRVSSCENRSDDHDEEEVVVAVLQ